MERLWKYIREERGIDLSDFSTDESVERCQAALREGEVELERRIAATMPPSRDLEHLLVDYRVIMNRRPHARTTGAMSASEAAALRARGATEDEIAEKIGRTR
ncbi:MAG: hypothetical protein Q7S02_06560 [bacterium]|nr:hypothetical protein [bacterium]